MDVEVSILSGPSLEVFKKVQPGDKISFKLKIFSEMYFHMIFHSFISFTDTCVDFIVEAIVPFERELVHGIFYIYSYNPTTETEGSMCITEEVARREITLEEALE